MRDASGQMYMRNRYYDPQSGQFTQPDPIGLAGGLNAYGFADGDPVSYSDPNGLCAASQVQRTADRKEPERVCPGGLTHGEFYAQEDGFSLSKHLAAAAKTRVLLMFVAKSDDFNVFKGCPTPVSHTESEGEFVGTWQLGHGRGFWSRRLVPRGGYRDPHVELQQFYRGTVRSHWGVTEAKGWVTCGTGEATFTSEFFLENLTRN
jgi:uncharacterized protein RhaS with RHS repeats